MPVSESSDVHLAIIDRLRAAGCVFAEDEAKLLVAEARTSADLLALVDQRVAGLPLEQVLGWTKFCGVRIELDAGVFVPRRRTEFLVHQATAVTPQGGIVVDLCCGSGAVGAALAAAVGPLDLHAVDIDPVAVQCARRNLATRGRVYEGDLFHPLPTELLGRVDVIVANAPYVPTEAIDLLPPEIRLHAASVATHGGLDGLDVIRRLTATAPQWLKPGGHLLFEVSERQAGAAVRVVADAGLTPTIASCEDIDATIVAGAKPITGSSPYPDRRSAIAPD